MNEINSPVELVATLTAMFPEFASEFDADEEVMTYHQVVRRLAPVITGYLEVAPTQIEGFGALLNAMVAAGGDKENAVSTCLLEHASQVSLRKIIRRHLSPAAKEQVR
jgi:hypothetical protein